MHKSVFGVFAVALLLSFKVHALGLGDITLESGLNQPLRASIKLMSTEGMRPSEVVATLAGDNEFRRAGIERFFFLNSIRFQTVRSPSGGLEIQLRTRTSIKEPFVNFLVELNWPAGKLVREYTLLLDPPIFNTEQRAAPTQPARSDSRVTRRQPPRQVTSRNNQRNFRQPSSRRTVPARRSAPQQQRNTESSHRVGSSDTAWNIANRYKGGNSVYKTITAIYEANPDAFDGDINKIKRGATLRIPSESEIQRTSRGQVSVVRNQIESFSERRSRIDVGVEGALIPESSAKAEPRLELMTPDANELSEGGVGGTGERDQLRRRLGEAKEATESLRLENAELTDRLDALSEQVDKLQRLISLKDGELAALAAKIAEQDANEGADETIPGAEDQFAVEDEAVVDESESQAAVEETTPAARKRNEKSLLDSVLESNYLIYGGAALVLLLAVVWFLRKRMMEEEYDDELLGGDFDAEVTFSGDFSDFDETSLGNTAFTEAGSQTNTGTMGSDPVSEADVYITYGKYEEAEELLLDAVAQDEQATDVHLKLFECYAEAKWQDKYQAHAQQYQHMLDADPSFNHQVRHLYTESWPADSFTTALDNTALNDEIPSTDDIFASTEEFSGEEFNETALGNEFDTEDGFSADTNDDFDSDEAFNTNEGFDANDAFDTNDDFDTEDSFTADDSFGSDDDFGSDLDNNETEIDPFATQAMSSEDPFAETDAGDSETLDTLDFENEADDDSSSTMTFDPNSAFAITDSRLKIEEVTGSQFAVEDFGGMGDESSTDASTQMMESIDDDLGNIDDDLGDLDSIDDIGSELDAGLDFTLSDQTDAGSATEVMSETEILGGGLDSTMMMDTTSSGSDNTTMSFDADFGGFEGQGGDIDFDQDMVEQLGGDMDDSEDDVDLNDALGGDDINEASTKLDLARAYIDMGDSDGARDILEEVVTEGDTSQQDEARALLEKI